MARTIMTTEDCYEGYCKLEKAWVTGSYPELKDATNLDIDPDKIQWSNSAWEDEKVYFTSFLNKAIANYEKRYHTTVYQVVLAGHVGRWNGSPVGGRFVDSNYSILEQMGDVDEIDVVADSDGEITIVGIHHDGRHRMHIYFLTQRKYDMYINRLDESPELFEEIYLNEKTLSTNMAKGYFSVSVAS